MPKYLACLLAFFILIGFCLANPPGKVYTGKYLQSLRVPIGGIGTGDVLIGGRGNMEHLEVFNRPDRRRRLEKSFFALWMKKGEESPIAKVLEREIFPPYQESTHKYVAGLPRFRNARFINRFPLQEWQLEDEAVPLQISMEAFNPFIPLDVPNSSFPLVAFYWDIKNNSSEPVKGAIVLNLENPIAAEAISNTYHQEEGWQGIRFTTKNAENINYQGGMFFGTTAQNVDIQTHWFPGEWRDETHIFWDDFSEDGTIEQKLTDWHTSYEPTAYNETTRRMASVLVHFDLQPGERLRIPFYLSWYFPKRVFGAPEVFGIQAAADKPFENAYSTQFDDELDVLERFLLNEPQLHELTARFAEHIQSSTYPESVKEALTTQASSLRTNLLQVTAEGNVHGFEGVLQTGWCCPGTCTHVWNYEQTVASLFPSLERKMRELEFLHNTFDNGFQAHRSVLPVGNYWFDGPPAADGQMGAIVRAYREWKLCGDNEWLAMLWPKIKKALEYAWYGPGKVEAQHLKHQERHHAWDPGKTGMLSGTQHNTYDINFFGPSSMTTSIYLAALKAAAEMAAAMKEPEKAKEYLEVYRSGVVLAQDSLWNGNYFVQIIPEEENTEKQMLKYQYGDGCLSDQLLGQYLAFIAGLDYILDESKVDQAIKAIYDHNFIRPLRDFANVQRVYGLNDESGIVLCTWPNDNRPALPFVYSDEIWTGVEYQVATSLIKTGFVEEGLEVVQAVQDRYDGFKRNPFEHDESGVHYARAMASWSVLLALSGIEYDGIAKSLSFDPQIRAENFSTFWSTGSAWGQFKVEGNRAVLLVEYGVLELKRFQLKGKKFQVYDPIKQLNAGDQLVLDFDE